MDNTSASIHPPPTPAVQGRGRGNQKCLSLYRKKKTLSILSLYFENCSYAQSVLIAAATAGKRGAGLFLLRSGDGLAGPGCTCRFSAARRVGSGVCRQAGCGGQTELLTLDFAVAQMNYKPSWWRWWRRLRKHLLPGCLLVPRTRLQLCLRIKELHQQQKQSRKSCRDPERLTLGCGHACRTLTR